MVSQTKSRKIPTRNILPLFFASRFTKPFLTWLFDLHDTNGDGVLLYATQMPVAAPCGPVLPLPQSKIPY